MAQYLPLPDGTYYPVAEGEDPKVAWQRAMQKYPEAFGAGEPKAQPKSGFMPALKAGVSSLKSDVAALAGRTGIMGLPEAEKYIAEQEKYQKATYKPTEEGFMEAPLTKIGELAGGSIPYMAAPIAAGAAAAALPFTGAAATVAGLGATGLASAAQFTGSNLSRQMETGKKLGETDIGAAAVAALPQAALDTISLRMIPGMGKLFEKAGLNISEEAAKNLAKEGLKKTVADYALSTGKTMGVEGLTEAGQQVFERMQAGLNITDGDARKEYFDNFIGGAVLGGILAPVGRRVERGGEQARFDKQQREEQKKQADEAKVAQDKLDAETLAKKQTPEYALQAQQAYLDAEQRKKDLKAKIHKAPKGQELTEDQKLDNQETSLALADHKTVLNNAAKEFRQTRQFLPTAAPEAIKDTEQLQQVDMFGNLPTPKTPELDLKGKPVERAAPEPEAEDQGNLQLQIRGLSDYLDQLRAQNAKIPATDTDAKIAIGEKYSSIKKMLTEVQKYVPPEVDTTAINTKIADLTKKIAKADEDGDVDISAKHAAKIKELQTQLEKSPAAPSPQQQMEMQPFKSTVTGDRQLAIRPQYAANLNLGAEEQEADVAAQQAQAEAQYRAKGTEQDRQIKIAPEVRALQRIGERPAGAVSTSPQFDMFGTEPETGASAAINQVKKGLTGGEELPTAEEEKAKKPVQRGGPAPFNLYARKEGTAEPVTAESLRQRIYDLQLRDDLSDEARAFLRRAAANVSDKDTTIGTNASLFTMLDEQISKIERNEEGIHGEGTPTKPLEVAPRGGEGEGAMAQALREAGATKPSSVTAPATSVTTPTEAERVIGEFAGKKYNLSSSKAAQALAKAKRAKYEAGIDAGLSKAEAANRARLVTQEEAVQGVMTGAGPTAVNVQGRAEPTLRTLRGPSTYAKPLSMPDALEQHLRVKEELAQEEGNQLPLFKEEELPSKALVRATPATFKRFLASKTVQELREREQELKEQTEPLEEANKVQASIAELQQQLKELTTRYEITQVAKNIVTSNAQADEAIAQYGKLQADPYFGAVLQLDAASKSEEYTRLEADVAALTKMVEDLPKQIKITQDAINKDAAKAGTPSEALKANRVKIEILTRQKKVLTDALGKLEGLQATAASVKAAKDHIDSMLHVIAAKRALDGLKGKEVSREQVVNAQTELHDAVLARRAAEANSKAKDEMRDVRDRSYATARKRQELSEQRTKAWNVLSQLPSTQYRRLTPEERGIIETVSPGEVTKALEYERHLAGMNVQSLKMELGQLDKASYALEAKIKEAKAKSESRLAPGEKLTMYGEKGSVFTKPAFVGVEGFIKKQAELADKRDALETELARKEAAMAPISKGARGEAAPREVATTRAAEQAEIDRVTEATNAADSARDRIEQLKAAYKESVAEGDTKAARAFVKEVAVARKDLSDANKEIGISQRRYAAQRKVAGEPSKLRTGTAESKAVAGVTKQTITEQRVEPKVSTGEIITSANEMAAEKIAAGKPLTKKEVKELTLKQQQALQAAAFDRVQTTTSQVADAQARVDAIQQAMTDYAAGKRAAPIQAAVVKKAKDDLAAFQKSNQIARQQAGILEDVGTVSKAEQAAEEVPKVKESDISGAVGPAVFRTITRKGASLKEQTIKRVADAITKEWSVVPDIIVIADESELPDNLRKQAERDEMIGKIPGLYDTETKKVYLIANNLFDENDIALTIAHEIAGHFGLREVLGSTYTKIMNYVYNGNASVRTAADAKMAKNKKLSREVAVEEVLAEAAEQGPQAEKGLMAALRRVWYAIKQALARVKVFNVSDAEINQIVVNARRYVQEGKGGKPKTVFKPEQFVGTLLEEAATKPRVAYYANAEDLKNKAPELYDQIKNDLDEDTTAPTYAFGELQPEGGLSRRQFLKGAAATIGALQLPAASTTMSNAQIVDAVLESMSSGYNFIQNAAASLPRNVLMALKAEAVGSEYRLNRTDEYLFKGMEKSGLEELADLQDALFNQGEDSYTVSIIEDAVEERGIKVLEEMQEIARAARQVFIEDIQNVTKGANAAQTKTPPATIVVLKDNIISAPQLSRSIATNMRDFGAPLKNSNAITNAANYRTKANYTSDDDLSKLAKDIVATKQGFFEKLGGNKMLQFEMLTTDMRAGLREAMKAGAKQMGDTRLFQQAMMSVTKADQKMPLVLTALSNGPLETYTDEKGFKGVRTTNENSAKEIFAAISEIPDSYGNGEAKMALATAYMIAQRAANKGLTKLDLKALEVTQEKLDAAMRQVAADPELKKALERTRSLYNKFNEGMIRFLASTGAITQKEADGFLKEGDYVPYYRVNANGLAQLVLGAEKTITIGDIRYQPHLAQLKGGETKIISLDESLPRNTMLLVEKAMTNMATRNVGYALYSVGKGNGEVNERTGKAGDLMPIHKGDGPPDPGVIRWNQEPDRNDPKDTGKRWLRVQTSDTVLGGIPAEIIVKSLEGAHLTLPGFLKLGAIAGDFLRAGVTRTPVYLLRQLFRDPFVAAATAGLDYGPIKAIYKAGNEYLKMNTGQSETAAKLIEKGLIQSGIFTGDPDDISKFALQLASGKDMGVMDKFFAMADNQAMKADAATRVLVYDNAIKNGLSEVEADMAVMESMNFHKRGLSPTVQYASRMIPFFNSQIQGLNVLFKAATGNMPFNEQLRIKQKFQNNAMMLMGMGLVYAMMMEDDEYFKNAKPKDKYSNFFVHIPGVDEPLKLPIPYEFGWFFSAAVATVDAMKAETDGPQQLRALREMFIGAIPGSSNAFVVPQIVKPIAEVWTNKSFFSGQPLESQRLRKLDPEARYYDTTTEIAKEISKLIPILSPIQIEHIVTGYLGSLPLMAAAATDGLFKGEEAAETPTRRLSQMPMIGSSFQRKYGGEDADVVYKLATEALQAKATFNEYKNTGKLNEAKEYFQEHRAELAVAPMALQYEKFMGNLRKQEQIIRQSSMPADKKRERIDLLDKQRQLQSERYAQAIKRAEAAIGRTTPQ